MYPEEILAVILATGLGVACLVVPDRIYRLQFFAYGADTGRRDRWGESGSPSKRWVLGIRVVGIALLGLAVAILVGAGW